MSLIGFIILVIIAGIFFDEKLGTTMALGGIQILFEIVITVICFGINPILGTIVGLVYFRGLSKQ